MTKYFLGEIISIVCFILYIIISQNIHTGQNALTNGLIFVVFLIILLSTFIVFPAMILLSLKDFLSKIGSGENSHRLNRRNYFIGTAITTIVYICFSVILHGHRSILISSLVIVAIAVFLLFDLSITIRRLHDIGYSGYYLLLKIIPLVNLFLFFLLFFKEGNKEPNKYGNPPLSTISFPRDLLSFSDITNSG
ncbi:MAG TPA: DUF805 domain-containing protein [Candidatus Saccharimonadales bacterium]|nr:DUF805 domain-containing protein [Candidatus Saccharimonadales bacterium]